MDIGEITVEELALKLSDSEATLQLIDVRESWELEVVSLPNFAHFPLSKFSEWSASIKHALDPDRETLVMCHHGVRSAQMCYWLLQEGFTNVKNVQGGIHAYSVRIDPSMNKY